MFLSYLKTLQSLRDKHLISLAQSQGPWDLFSRVFLPSSLMVPSSLCGGSRFICVFGNDLRVCVCVCVCVLVAQSYLTLCNPIARAYFHPCTSDCATDSN